MLPITDPNVPVVFLRTLLDSDVGFAVIHGEERIGTPELVSDVDIVIDRPFGAVVTAAASRLKSYGLVTALAWPYDVGGTASLFVATADGVHGSQIDLLYDPAGKGRYGLRSNVLLGARGPGSWFPIISALDRDLYLLRKARCKGRTEVAEEIVAKLEIGGMKLPARRRAQEVFSRRAARDVVDDLERRPERPSIAGARILTNARRFANRIAHPIGFWVELVGPSDAMSDLALELATQFGAWLVRVEADRRPGGTASRYWWWLTEVTPVRLRPGLYISWTNKAPKKPHADLMMSVGANEPKSELATRIVASMALRIPK